MNASALVAVIVGGLGAIAAAYFGFRSTRRQTSGSVATTEAAKLWEESSAIRREAVARAEKIQSDFDDLRDAHRLLEARCDEQRREIEELRKENEDNHRIITNLRVELDQLQRKIGAVIEDEEPQPEPPRRRK